MKENYVTDPRMNKDIDSYAFKLMQLRDIYYVIPFNSFMAFKHIGENGEKVYSGLCNFLNDATTYIANMAVTDEYVAENCILLKDIETLDKYAFQKDQSVNLGGSLGIIKSGAYCVRGTFDDNTDPKTDLFRIRELEINVFNNPNFKKLPYDPSNHDPYDDFLDIDDMDMDDRDDHNLDY